MKIHFTEAWETKLRVPLQSALDKKKQIVSSLHPADVLHNGIRDRGNKIPMHSV